MLKTETNTFGEIAARVNLETGETVSPGRAGVKITATQLPVSRQREPFEYLCRNALPENAPPELLHRFTTPAGRGGPPDMPGATEGASGAAERALLAGAYSVVRRLAATPGAIEYLQGVFGTSSVTEVIRKGKPVTVPLTSEVWDEIAGGDLSIVLEFLAWSIVFNFASVVNLLPEWSKEAPSIVAAARDAGQTTPQ